MRTGLGSLHRLLWTEQLTLSVDSQHWMGPVEQESPVGDAAGAVTVTVLVVAGAEVGVFHRFPLGVATARSAREANVNVMDSLANMVARGVRERAGKAWEVGGG